MTTTLINTPITIDPNEISTSEGWAISGGVARHSGCYPGTIILNNIVVLPSTSYVVEYKVSEYTSGGVYAKIGGVNGTNRTALGEYSQTIDVPSGATDLTIKFYSDGELGIVYFNVYPVVSVGEGAVTIGFNAKENKWTSDYILYPESMIRFIGDLYSFKDGALWKHNANPTRNLLHGVQSTSKITFICNVNNISSKLWFNLRLDSKGTWTAPSLTTASDDKFPNGMVSRLKKNNFKSVDGKLWADILRDINDPNLSGAMPAPEKLYKGRVMEGTYIIVELECADTTEIKLVSAELYYTDVNRTI